VQLNVVDNHGTHVGALEVSDLLFGIPMNTSVVHQTMLWHQTNARQGTASTKTRAQVSGGGAKPRPQKHTGRSRQGSIRSPQWRGGGVVFGPHVRDFKPKILKKVRRLAIRCMLSNKVREDQIRLVQMFDIPDAKSKEMKRILMSLNANSSVLVVTPQKDNNVVLSARNLGRVTTLPATNLNVVDLLKHDYLVMTVDAVRKAEEIWAGGATPGSVIPPADKPVRKRTPRKSSGKTVSVRASSQKAQGKNGEA
jgi:large subunit ribosomal protein L4